MNSIASKIKGVFFTKKDDPFLYKIQKILGFKPSDIDLYRHAFVHSSVLATRNLSVNSNERLEFLGDAILGAVVADLLYEKFPDRDEGFLTQTRSQMVKRVSLDKVAYNLGLGDLMITQKNLVVSVESHINGNAFEALMGAVYIDKGYAYAKKFLNKLINEGYFDQILNVRIKDKLTAETEAARPVRTSLNEWAQMYRQEIKYEVDRVEPQRITGRQVIYSSLYLNGKVVTNGQGSNKKESFADAAGKLQEMIEDGRITPDKSVFKLKPSAKKAQDMKAQDNKDSGKNPRKNNAKPKNKKKNNKPADDNNKPSDQNKPANGNDKPEDNNDHPANNN